MKKKSIKAFVDRIEGKLAVVYLGANQDYKVDIPVKFLPKGITEDTHLKIDFSVDEVANKELVDEIEDLRKKLMGN